MSLNRKSKIKIKNYSRNAEARPERTMPRPLISQKAAFPSVKFFGSNASALNTPLN